MHKHQHQHQALGANPEDAKGCASLDGPESLHIVYTSQLAPGEDYTAYGRICRVARQRNGSLAVSGVLLFDGQRFCQWLHGEPDATARLMLSIARDKRHAAVQVRLQAMLPSDAIAPGWRAGFVDGDTLEQFMQQPATGTDQVLAALGRLLAAADIEPAMPQARPGGAAIAPGASCV